MRHVIRIAAGIIIALGACPVGAGDHHEAPPFKDLVTAHLCGLERIGFTLYLSDRWGKERVKTAESHLLQAMVAGGIPVVQGNSAGEAPQFYVSASIAELEDRCAYDIHSGIREPVKLLRAGHQDQVWASTWQGEFRWRNAQRAEDCWEPMTDLLSSPVRFFITRWREAQETCGGEGDLKN